MADDATANEETSSANTTECGGLSIFEQIRHTGGDGAEYWSARELAKALGYTEYGKFSRALEKAVKACESSEQPVADHFARVSDMITVGKGARRKVEDVHLSRYGCYLVVQNADPEKEIVALGQTYFAVQTRRAELQLPSIDAALADLSEDQQRLYLRGQVRVHNANIADVVADISGIVTSRQFAIFQDHGYRGLYNGETARDIAARKGLGRSQRILDYMGSEELAANLFRVTQTEAKIRRDEISTPSAANRTHHDVGAAVRRFIIEELGGTPPEQLSTPAQGIQQIERAEQQRVARE